jgi:hypothetical protein
MLTSVKTNRDCKPPRMFVDALSIPHELRARKQWVVWSWRWNGERWDKPPLRLSGAPASSTDPSSWMIFDHAEAAVRSGKFDGVGYVFTSDDPYCGIDLDRVRDPDGGELEEWAVDQLRRLDSYCEISPSGTGVKLWAKATKPGKDCRRQFENGEIEVYDKARYFCMTGQRLPGTPATINERQEQVSRFYERVFRNPAEKNGQAHAPTTGQATAPHANTLSDADIIRLASESRNGDKFKRLWAGQLSDYGDDDSRADSALLCMLCFYSRDPNQLDSLFRQSGLYREKWDRPDYRQRTIDHALSVVKEQYRGKSERRQEQGGKPANQEAAADGGYRFNPIDSPTFASKNLLPKWLVKRILVEGMATVVGGPRKSLKTTIVCDLVISAASATPFLGTFDVPCAIPSAFISGESGDFTIQETSKRICAAKGIDLATLPIWWDFRLPQFAEVSHLASLRDGLKERGIRLCAIDPIYLSLMGGDAGAKLSSSDLFDMGPLLLSAGRACLDAGATPILAHHTKKATATSLEPLELEDLSGAGVAEFARTWLLLSRFEPYEAGSGVHKLWMAVGGSVGFGSLSALQIEEGPIADDFSGRKWQVTVIAAGDARAKKRDEKEEEKTTKTEQAHKKEEGKVLVELDKLTERMKDKERKYPTVGELKTATHLSGEKLARTLYRLSEASVVEIVKVTIKIGKGRKAEREVDAVRRKTRTNGTNGTNGIFPIVPPNAGLTGQGGSIEPCPVPLVVANESNEEAVPLVETADG